MDTKLEKRNFRKKMLKMGILNELEEYEQNVSYRAGRLYAFDETKYKALLENNKDFKLKMLNFLA